MHFDATSIVAFVFVLIFLGLLLYLGVFRKLAAALDGRAARIAAELEEAKRLREEAQSVLADYRKRAQTAEREAAEIVQRAREDAERLREESERKLAETIERRTKAAETKIAQAEQRALADVRAAAAEVAVTAAQRVLGSRVAGGFGQELVASSIEQVRSRFN
jgi:F-type H+-transporting ATPase subunit b